MDEMAKTNSTGAGSTMSRRAFIGTAAVGFGLAALGQLAGPLVGVGNAQASTGTPQRIADHFTRVRTMMGEFVQFGPRGEQTGGKFFIERPGKVRFNYEAPSSIQVTSDGRTLVLENTKLKTADIYPLSQTPLKLLLDDRIDMSDGKVRNVTEEDDLTTIQLADKSTFGNSTITMMFDPGSYELRQWTITDAQGKDTTVMIFNVQEGVTFDPSVFAIDHRKVQEMQRRGTNR